MVPMAVRLTVARPVGRPFGDRMEVPLYGGRPVVPPIGLLVMEGPIVLAIRSRGQPWQVQRSGRPWLRRDIPIRHRRTTIRRRTRDMRPSA